MNHGIIKDFPGKPEKYDMFVDQAFIYVHEQFVEGTCKKKIFKTTWKHCYEIKFAVDLRHVSQRNKSNKKGLK